MKYSNNQSILCQFTEIELGETQSNAEPQTQQEIKKSKKKSDSKSILVRRNL